LLFREACPSGRRAVVAVSELIHLNLVMPDHQAERKAY
jgi:hypothetical protein